ncbi:MAG: helix-turn-helix transcriptional regulator [Bacillota bacterium]|nr:helix-turn-helix transcriptional regulator [Bacillota bacterium]
MTIGDNIKRISAEKSITIYRLAKEGELSNSYLSEIVNNKKTNPSIDILRRICKVLKVSIEELIAVEKEAI